MTPQERKRILLTHIYGVDIDPQAVEVTKLSLLLKVLEGENAQAQQLSFAQERVLPDLDHNIRCGNSLIGPDYYEGQQLALFDEEAMYRVNAFDWKEGFPQAWAAGGFDAVIGNPPYGMVTDKELQSYLENHFETTEGRLDNYELFIEIGVRLCRKQGFLGFIVPSPLLSNLYARKLRQCILVNCAIQEITNFGMDVFSDPTVHTCIIIVSKAEATNQVVKIRKQVENEHELKFNYDYTIPQSQLGQNDKFTFDIFLDPQTWKIIEKIQAGARTLGEVCFIRQCIKTGNDKIYVKSSDTVLGEPWKPTLGGRSIGRYATFQKNLWMKYGTWLARNWKNKTFYETPKIVVRETGNRIIATVDLENRYVLSSLYAIYPKNSKEPMALLYLLGLLNSLLATYFIRIIALNLTKGAFTKVRTNQLARFPIRTIDFDNPADAARHDKMVSLVETMLDLHKKLAEAKTPQAKRLLQQQITLTDRQIDALVYELYGLTEDEIEIVEGA